jgi:hypothetical protein
MITMGSTAEFTEVRQMSAIGTAEMMWFECRWSAYWSKADALARARDRRYRP